MLKRWLFTAVLVLLVSNVRLTTAAQVACADVLSPMLTAGNYAYVLPMPPTPQVIHAQAGKSGSVVAKLAPGTQFYVMDGPVCANGIWWWHIKNNQYHVTGWLAQGDNKTYYVEPVMAAGTTELAPAASGPAGVIAFVGLTDIDETGHEIYDIYLTNGDGSHRLQVTHNAHVSDVDKPSFNGKRIAYVGTDKAGKTPGLYSVDADGSNVHFVGEGYGNPSWFPKGELLLVTVHFNDKPKLAEIDDTGVADADITPDLEGIFVCPALSPDATHVAFVGIDADQIASVYIMDAHGSHLIKVGSGDTGYVLSGFSGGGCPAWSPDSQHIAFALTSSTNKGGVIMSANADGSDLAPMFKTAKDYYYGSLGWSSDGTYLVYSVITTPGKPSVPNDWTLAVIPVGVGLNDSSTKPVYIAKGLNAVWQQVFLSPDATLSAAQK